MVLPGSSATNPVSLPIGGFYMSTPTMREPYEAESFTSGSRSAWG